MIDKNGRALLELANTQKQSIDSLREYIAREEDFVEVRNKNLAQLRKTLDLMEVNYNYMLAEFCTVEHSSDMSDKEIVPHVFQVWRVAPNKKIEAIKAFRECFSKKSNSISLSDTLGLGEAKRIVEGGTCHLWASKEQIAKFKDFMIARGVAMDIRLVPIAPNDTVEFSYTLTLHFRL